MAKKTSIKEKTKQLFNSVLSSNKSQTVDHKPTEQQLNIGQFSPAELQQLLPSKSSNYAPIKTSELHDYITTSTKKSQDIIKELSALKALSPDIEEAKRIYVSSIMSPNDMQQNAIRIAVTCNKLPDATNDKLSSELTTFFNDTYGFGVKLTKWMGECFYETGAKAIVVLPKSNNRILIEATNKSIANEQWNYNIDKNVNLSNLKDLSSVGVSTEAIITNLTNETNDSSDIFDISLEILSSHESFSTIKDKDKSKIVNTVTSSISNFLKEHKNYIIVSDNPSIVKDRKDSTNRTKKDLQKRVDDYFMNTDQSSSIMLLDDNSLLDSDDFPSVIEFPTEAVVPICVPGSSEEHLGYFVLVDEWGNPINQAMMDSTTTTLTQKAKVAMYGNNNIINTLSDTQKNKATETVFGITLNNIMQQKLNSLGVASATVSQNNSLSNCVFQQLLKKKKVGLIFVPESLMIYYRFDHRPDGTGKSMIETVSTVLSLRATLLIANTMAAVKEAVNEKVIELQIDPKDMNVEQTINTVRQMYTEKQMLRFQHDHNAISRDLTNRSLKIIPKGIAGLPNSLNTTTNTNSSNNNKAGSELLETFTNMSRPGLGVPAAALNQLNENEFSRSIVTQNLFFADTIRDRQRVVATFNNKFVRTYIKYSVSLREIITELINKQLEEFKNDKTQDDNTIEIENNLDLFNDVLSSISVTLPTPSVSTNKAQYEEIQEHITMLSTILDTLFSDELVGMDDNETKDLMTSIKALMKTKMVRSFLTTIGFQGNFNIPQLEDAIDLSDELTDITKSLLNLKKGLADRVAVLKKEEESNSRY